VTNLIMVAVGWLLGWWAFGRPRTVDGLRAPSPTAPARTVSVVVPARNEATSLPLLLADLATARPAGAEIVVVDDHSTDDTARVAAEAGARVADAAAVLPEYGGGHGKGEVLWKSLHVTEGDVVLWCDSDISEFGPRFVTGLLGPLLCEPGVDLAKGFYRRPERDREGGGRVTELVARPLLSLYFPELVGLHQPLSGEYGGVDLGVRRHRNRPLSQLGPQAMTIMQVALRRHRGDIVPEVSELIRPDTEPLPVSAAEMPALVDVPEYCERHPRTRA